MRRAFPPACSISSLAKIQFRLAARQQPDAGAGLRETHREPFSDAAAGAGNQHILVSTSPSRTPIVIAFPPRGRKIVTESTMSIRTQQELAKLRAIGRIVRATLDRTAAAVRPGVTTAELDEIGARVLAENGAESAPPKVYGFPGALCISVNEEAIHGIPGDRVIREGDLVKLDLVAEKDGYFADAAVTVTAAPCRRPHASWCVAPKARSGRERTRPRRESRLRHRARRGAGDAPLRLSGDAGSLRTRGGTTIHEAPSVPNYHDGRFRQRLTEGLVITVEPIIAAGRGPGVRGRQVDDPHGRPQSLRALRAFARDYEGRADPFTAA